MKLPPKLRQKGKAYYYDHGGKPRKWERLGSVYATALIKWADIHKGRDAELRTVGSLVDLFISKKQTLAESTLRSYRLYKRVLDKVNASPAPMLALDQGHLHQLIDDYPKKQIARNTALFVKTVYAWAVSRGHLQSSPFTGMRLKGTSRRRRYLTDAEFLSIRQKLEPKFQVAADLAYLLGLRVSEVPMLRFADFKDGVVTIRQQKTKSVKQQIITEDVKAVLERAKTLPGAVRGLALVCNRSGQPYSPQTISGAFFEASKLAGIKDVRFHDIRAKSASDETATAQARLGHATSQTTQIYLRKPIIATPINKVKDAKM